MQKVYSRLIMHLYDLGKVKHRYHKAKTPENVCWSQTFGGCAIFQRILGSIAILEKIFEPIVYKA